MSIKIDKAKKAFFFDFDQGVRIREEQLASNVTLIAPFRDSALDESLVQLDAPEVIGIGRDLTGQGCAVGEFERPDSLEACWSVGVVDGRWKK